MKSKEEKIVIKGKSDVEKLIKSNAEKEKKFILNAMKKIKKEFTETDVKIMHPDYELIEKLFALDKYKNPEKLQIAVSVISKIYPDIMENLFILTKDKDIKKQMRAKDIINKMYPNKKINRSKLTKKEEKECIEQLKKRFNIPISILEKLSINEDKNVRWIVALYPDTPAKILANLSSDKDKDVRNAVAKNSNIISL